MKPQVWHTLVVRLWRDGDGLKVRFLASQTGQRPSDLSLATSVESATRQFEQWLRSIEPDDEARRGRAPAPRRTTPRDGAADASDDDGATGADTARS